MISTNKRRLAMLALASAFVGTLVVTAGPSAAMAATPPGPFFNGFENAGDAVSPVTSGTEPMFDVNRVASGTGGVNAASGDWYAQAAYNPYTSGTLQPFSRLGGYGSSFPTDGYTVSVDAYLDMSQNTTVGTDLRFDWSSAVTNMSGGHVRDFIFHVGTNPAASGEFVVSASNNAPGWPANPARTPFTVSESGWYTFEHDFKNVGGVLSVDMNILNADGLELATWTLSNSSDVINSTIGGNRYGWLVDNDFSMLALDNLTRSGKVQCTTTCYVDAANGNDANGGATADDAKKTIQAAVSQVSAGGTVQVAAGTYTEQVVADHNMTIEGAGKVATTIKAPASMVAGAEAGRYAIVEIRSGANVELSDVTVSGPGPSGCGSLHYGILVTGAAHLNAHDMTIADIRDSSLSGCQNGNGLQVGRQAISQNGTADIENVTVTGYQKTGLIVDNSGSSMTVTNSTITGVGATAAIAQNGIQISRGATATVSNSNISDNEYTGTENADSTDILLYQAGNNVALTSNRISSSDVGIDLSSSAGTGIAVNNNSIVGNTAGLDNSTSSLVDATCNWWGAADGPSGQGSGSGDSVSTQATFEPWLESNELDGPCSGVSLRGVLTPAAHVFDDQAVNTTSEPSTFTFTNEGHETLNVTDVSLAGTHFGQFEVDTNNCDSAALSHDQSCTIDLVFEPNSTGAKTARLEIDSNDPHTPTAVSNLTGNGTNVVANNGTITIVLDSRPDGAQSFGFTGGLGSFNLTDPATNSYTISKPAGDYVVKATTVNGWSLKSLTCTTSESVQPNKGKVTLHLTSGENTTCTFTQTRRLPDQSIALSSGGPYTGTGVYAATAQANQTLNQVITGSQTKSFFVRLTNNSLDSDSFKVHSTLTGSTKFAVKFFNGATDITARVNAGTYNISLNAGQTANIQVQVKAAAGTPASATRNIDLTMKSKSSTSKDVVRGHVSRI